MHRLSVARCSSSLSSTGRVLGVAAYEALLCTSPWDAVVEADGRLWFRVLGGDRHAALRVLLALMVGTIGMSLLSLWLLAQPTFMRTADL